MLINVIQIIPARSLFPGKGRNWFYLKENEKIIMTLTINNENDNDSCWLLGDVLRA